MVTSVVLPPVIAGDDESEAQSSEEESSDNESSGQEAAVEQEGTQQTFTLIVGSMTRCARPNRPTRLEQ